MLSPFNYTEGDEINRHEHSIYVSSFSVTNRGFVVPMTRVKINSCGLFLFLEIPLLYLDVASKINGGSKWREELDR